MSTASLLLCALILLWAVPVIVAILAEEWRYWRGQEWDGQSWSECCLDSRDGLFCEHQRAAA